MANRLSDASAALNDLVMKSIKIPSASSPERYRLCTSRSNLDTEGKIRKWTFGQKCVNMTNRTILMVGETGTGKTTAINTIINYYLGVKFEDKVWFEITEEEEGDQTESKTSEITAYEIISENKPFFLTIIDTPGYGDTRGIDQDMKIAQNLYKLFINETGVKALNAVCLVLKASQNRISDRQRYIFEGVLSLFGKDIKDIVVLFITHSDGGPPTNALESTKKEKIPCCQDEENEPVHFLFNNRQSEKRTKRYEPVFRSSWEMGEKSMEEFFAFLESAQRKGVILTILVLKERMQLEACVQSLKGRIELREEQQKELNQIQEALKQNKEVMMKDQDFQFTVTTVFKLKVDVTDASWKNRKVTSCEECKENCHEFGCWWVSNTKWCEVMKDDHCTVCKCHYSKHVKESRKYVTKKKEEKVTFKDLKDKYSHNNEPNVSFDTNSFKEVKEGQDKELKRKEEMIKLESNLKRLLEKNEKEKKHSVKEAYETIVKLSVIALKPDSAFTIKHLDFLIPRVQEAGEAEWLQNLKHLQKAATKEKTGKVSWMVSNFELLSIKN